jgi:GNAT superfamily N-acetyltransferase
MGFTSLEAAPPSGGFTPIEVPSTPPVKESGDGKHFYEEGFLGRAAKGLGEGVAKLVTDKATNEALAKKEAGDKKVDLPTPSFGESLKQMASQAAEHPLDTIGHFAEGMAADPELLFPGLWEFMPAKMAAIVAKGGATAEVAATATRAVAIGGVAETVAQLTEEGKLDPQKIANNAAMFGVMGGVTHAVIKGAGTGFTSLKDTIVKPKEETHAGTSFEDFVKNSGKHLEEAQKTLSELNNPPSSYEPSVALEAKKRSQDFLEKTKDIKDNDNIEDSRIYHRQILKQADAMLEGDGLVVKRTGNYIDTVDVPEEYQRKGLGSSLVKDLETTLLKEGYKSAFLLAKPESVGFWEKQGYRKDPAHIAEVGENVPMNKKLHKPEKVSSKVDPSYEKSKMKPSESVPEALARVKEEKRIAEGKPRSPLSVTKKDGSIHIDKEAATADFHNNFDYIFNPDSPTGKQKAEMMAQMGITREKFKEMVTTPEEYGQFLKGHEESHVANNDYNNYPRTVEGKPDLMHQDAIEIEARATQDGLNAIRHASTIEEGIEVVKTAQRDIRADTRNAEVFSRNLTKSIENEGLRGLVTRSLEGEKEWDKLWTDKEKQEKLFGTGKKNAAGYPDKGMRGALDGMKSNLEKDKIPANLTKEQYAEKIAKLQKVFDHRISLGSEEHAIPILEQIKARFKEIGERAVSVGLMDGLLENYVTHVLDFSKNKLNAEDTRALTEKLFGQAKDSKLKKDFTEQRQYTFLRELEKAVEGTGIVVHTDIAKILEAYEKSMQAAIAHKAMTDHFEKTNAPNGKGWIVPLSEEALKEGYKPFQGKGSTPLAGKLVHPDLVDVMKHMFEQQEPEMILRALGGISHLTKSLETVGSLFHAYSLATAHAVTDPLHFAKEVFSGGAGIRRAVDNFKHGGPEDKIIDGFIRNGLVATTEDIQRTIVAETGKTVDKLISRFAPEGTEFKILQHATDPLDKHVLQRLNKYTWDYMHTGQKLNLANHLFTKAKIKNPEMSDAALQKEISGFINNSFGGLDWLEVASQVEGKYLKAFAMKAAGIHGRAWGQVLLFAPDWTVSTIRAFSTALPKEVMKPSNWELKAGIKGMWNPTKQGDFARRYVFNTAVAYLTILNGTNIAISGHPIWENKDPTRIDLGDGTSMQPAKHSMEAAEWVHNPMKTLGNKLGFWPKATTSMITGLKYPGPDAPKIKDNTALGRVGAVAEQFLPFAAGSAIQAPEGEGGKRAIMSSLGMPIYGIDKEELHKRLEEGKIKARQKRMDKIQRLREENQ